MLNMNEDRVKWLQQEVKRCEEKIQKFAEALVDRPRETLEHGDAIFHLVAKIDIYEQVIQWLKYEFSSLDEVRHHAYKALSRLCSSWTAHASQCVNMLTQTKLAILVDDVLYAHGVLSDSWKP